MKMGIVGLGRMGEAIAYRALEGGHEVVAFDINSQARKHAKEMGATIADSLEDVAAQTRIVWLMVPAGDTVDNVIHELKKNLKKDDIIIDGGNSKYTNSIRRAKELARDGIFFLDCGTSGGVYGRANGFCLMVGGDDATYTKVHPILEAIAAPGGMGYIGPSGTGHYVKMVHNGIEYALLQAYAEGLHLIKDGAFKDQGINLEELTRIWNVSSIIRSFILDLAHNIFIEHNELLKDISGEIAESGMGKWTVEEADKVHIPVRVIDEALKIRAWSRETGGNYATKIVAMLRKEFGGHPVKKIEE
jgi:6-phosphogluconate dehydrogenase